MAVPDTKTALAIGEIESSQASTMNNDGTNIVVSSNNEHAEKPYEVASSDDYPHGLTLVLLISATMIAVFLIALDQVKLQYVLKV